ncbi:MAG: sugar ABC transporter permease [Candidatus Korarchaeota archaeon]|nr:sugar ABC transporter permease [Candidatus Korarchaeota archaeon]
MAIFLLPSFALIVVFYLLPVLLTLLISFTDMDYSFQWNWVGLKNYVQMVSDPIAGKVFNNTLLYVFSTLALFNVGAALVISLITVHIPERVGQGYRALWLLPRITPSTVYALLWLWAVRQDPTALFNWILGFFGMEPVNWLHKHPWPIVILVNGFVGASFGMIIFTAALKSIPADYLRAARVDGASTLQIIRHIELPLIKWPLMFVTAYQTLSLLTSYEYILLVTNGGPGYYTTEVWALYSYHLAFAQYGGIVKFGYGAALATVLVILGLILSIAYWRVFRLRELMVEPKIEV